MGQTCEPRQDLIFKGVSPSGARLLERAYANDLNGKGYSLLEHEGNDAICVGTPFHHKLYGPGNIISLKPGEKAEPQKYRTSRKLRRNARIIGYILAGTVGGAAIAGILAALYYNRRIMPPPGMGYYGGYGYGMF